MNRATPPLVAGVMRPFGACLPILAASFFLAAQAPSANAAPLPVNHHSFENANLGGAMWTNDLTDNDPGTTIEWMGRDGNGDGDAFIELIAGGSFSSHGSYHIGMATGYFVYQDTTVPWEADTRYTVTVGVGNRTGFTNGGNISVIGLTDTAPVFEANTGSILINDPLFAAASTTTNASTIAAMTFQDLQFTYETDDNPPAGTVVIVLGDNSPSQRSHFDNVRIDATPLADLTDPDMDGLPTNWEIDNGLDPNSSADPNGAGHDLDNDGSTNLEEFQRGTKADDPDTDGDNALDGHETNTGFFNSLTDIGTDPLNPDTDGDTLLDGDEVAIHQTDPNNRDSDSDNFEDQAEIAAGTNPTSAISRPAATGDFVLGINFVGGRLGGIEGGVVAGPAGVITQDNWNNLEDAMGFGEPVVDNAGTGTMLRADWTVDGIFTINNDLPADNNAALMKGYLRPRAGVTTEISVWNIPYPTYDVYVYADGNQTDGVGNFTVNGQTVSGVQDTSNWPIATGGGTFRPVGGNDSPGNYLVFRDVTGGRLTVTGAPATGTYGAPINAIQIVRAVADQDGDTMPDIYEDAHGLDKTVNDAGGDLDSDFLTNLEEFNLGTLPNNDDTDGDSLLDGHESNDGTYVSATQTGTDPLLADTDGDTLPDGTENNSGTYLSDADPGTNPNLADTDGDGYTDDAELFVHFTDPNDPNDKPAFPVATAYWPFDDQGAATTADATGNGNDGTVNGGLTYVPGVFGSAISTDGIDDSVTTAVPLLNGLSEFTVAGWVNFTVEQPARTGFFGQNDVFEFGLINANTLSAWSGSAVESAFGPTTTDWHHVALTNDASGRVLYIDGAQVATGTSVTLGTSGFNFNIAGSGVWDGTGNFFTGMIDDVAVWTVALAPGDISSLANGLISPLGSAPSDGSAFLITAIDHDPITNTTTITFNSQPGTSYEVEYFTTEFTDPGMFVGTDDVVATDVSTTVVIDHLPPADARMFRVRNLEAGF